MNKMLSIVSVMMALVFLSACNTIEGIGKDVKKGGEVIEKTAEKAKS